MLSSFERGVKNHPEWQEDLDRCKHVLLSSQIPEDPEIQFASKFFQLKLLVCYDSLEPIQSVGHASWPQVLLSNVPVADGSGHAVAHFRYIWSEGSDNLACHRDYVEQAILWPMRVMSKGVLMMTMNDYVSKYFI